LKICLSPKKFGFFWAKLFLGALFTKVICTFLKSVRKDGFFDASTYSKKKSFHLLEGTMNIFEELKRSKMEETAQYFEKRYFINRSQLFIALPKVYATH